MIKFRCKCGQKIGFPDEQAGKICKCPKCSTVCRIPSHSNMAQNSSSMKNSKDSLSHSKSNGKARQPISSPQSSIIHFKCISCGEDLEAPDVLRGKSVLCPNCGCNVEVSDTRQFVSLNEKEEYDYEQASTACRKKIIGGIIASVITVSSLFTILYINSHKDEWARERQIKRDFEIQEKTRLAHEILRTSDNPVQVLLYYTNDKQISNHIVDRLHAFFDSGSDAYGEKFNITEFKEIDSNTFCIKGNIGYTYLRTSTFTDADLATEAIQQTDMSAQKHYDLSKNVIERGNNYSYDNINKSYTWRSRSSHNGPFSAKVRINNQPDLPPVTILNFLSGPLPSEYPFQPSPSLLRRLDFAMNNWLSFFKNKKYNYLFYSGYVKNSELRFMSEEEGAIYLRLKDIIVNGDISYDDRKYYRNILSKMEKESVERFQDKVGWCVGDGLFITDDKKKKLDELKSIEYKILGYATEFPLEEGTEPTGVTVFVYIKDRDKSKCGTWQFSCYIEDACIKVRSICSDIGISVG